MFTLLISLWTIMYQKIYCAAIHKLTVDTIVTC